MQAQRPSPPEGFIPFKWQAAFSKDGTTIYKCPNCGAPEEIGDHCGRVWGHQGFTDPGAQAAFDQSKVDGWRCQGALDNTYTCDGVPILTHWSRFSEGRCMICECQFWHDFVGKWQDYYKPTPGVGKTTQLGLF